MPDIFLTPIADAGTAVEASSWAQVKQLSDL